MPGADIKKHRLYAVQFLVINSLEGVLRIIRRTYQSDLRVDAIAFANFSFDEFLINAKFFSESRVDSLYCTADVSRST